MGLLPRDMGFQPMHDAQNRLNIAPLPILASYARAGSPCHGERFGKRLSKFCFFHNPAMALPGKARHALYALHIVHVYARLMAYERADHAKLATVFDIAELMPAYMDAARDRTKAFRGSLVDMIAIDERFGRALRAFDATDVPRWHGEDVCPSA